MSTQDKPRVTVVTVTYNEERNLATTIESIIQQTYRSKEYIIVDGNSSDRTPEIISQYSDHIDKLICEPDDGVYDAMNKAIDIAGGEWIIFINAGDILCDSEVLSRVFQYEITAEIDFIYENEANPHIRCTI